MNRTLLLAGLLLLGGLTWVPSGGALALGAEIEEAYWGPPGAPTEAAPGEHGRTLTVQLRNIDSHAFYAVEAELREAPGYNASFPGSTTDHFAGNFTSGSVWNAQFTVDLDEDLEPGTELTIPIQIVMRAGGAGPSWSVGTYRHVNDELTLPVPGMSRLSVEAGRTAVGADAETHVPLEITNVGSAAAKTLDVQVAPAEGSTLLVRAPQAPYRIAQLAPGATATVPTTILANGPSSLQVLAITLTYVNGVGTTVQATFQLPLTVTDWTEAAVSTDLVEEQVTAGRTNELAFTITNGGDHAITDLEATLTVPPASQASPATAAVLDGADQTSLGTVAPGTAAELRIPIYVSRAASDLVPLTLELRWIDEAGFQRSQQRTYGLVVIGAIDLAATGLTAQLDRATGQLTVEGTLTNTGNAEATNLYLRVLEAPGIQATPPRYQGDLDADAPLPFSLQTPANATLAPDNATLSITWTDDHGQARELRQHVDIVRVQGTGGPSTAPGDEDGSSSTPGLGVVALGAVVVLAAACAVHRRRER